jgi:hypothetical protein
MTTAHDNLSIDVEDLERLPAADQPAEPQDPTCATTGVPDSPGSAEEAEPYLDDRLPPPATAEQPDTE